MIKFRIDEKEYTLPEHITIEHYAKIYKVKDMFSDDYFAARLINIVSDAPVEDLLNADFQEVSYMASYVMELLPLDKPEFKDRFELDGIHYGFFPSWRDLSFAEFIDMDTIAGKKPEELLEMLHILAAVMFRPITEEKSQHDFKIEKYDVNTMTERAELFKKKLDVKYILAAQFFFIKFAKRYSSYTHLSSMTKLSIWQKMGIIWTMRRVLIHLIFRKRSAGSWSSTELLTMILQNTKLSTKKK